MLAQMLMLKLQGIYLVKVLLFFDKQRQLEVLGGLIAFEGLLPQSNGKSHGRNAQIDTSYSRRTRNSNGTLAA